MRWKKFMNERNFLLRVMWFFECWSDVISNYPVKFSVHRTCGTGYITFVICHEITYSHLIKEPWTLCMMAKYYKLSPCWVWWSWDITFFICHATIVSCDHCGWWPLLISHHHFKFSRIWPRGNWNIKYFICHINSRDQVNKRTCVVFYQKPPSCLV